MHPLNLFPSLLNLSLLAPFILRLIVGLIFLDLGILKFRAEKENWLRAFETLHIRPAELLLPFYAILQVVGGALLLIGFWTQVAALALALFVFAELFVEWRAKEVLKRDLAFYILIFAICLSLLFTGAGAFAYDLPL